MDTKVTDIAATAARLKRLYTAAVYDIMDEMGVRNQCLDLAIKPIDGDMKIAGPAFTIAGAPNPSTDDEYENEEVKNFSFFKRMYPGCVVLVAAAGERQAGHWGELMSTAAKARGATGVVIDGGTRDGNLMKDISDWSVFTRYTSPIESKHRYRISAIEKPVAISGSLTNQIRVEPGDWVFGDMDGVVIVPQGLVNEVLAKAEEVGEIEDAARIDIRNGIDVKAVFDKYGRL